MTVADWVDPNTVDSGHRLRISGLSGIDRTSSKTKGP